jgi:serine/threonine protein kinase
VTQPTPQDGSPPGLDPERVGPYRLVQRMGEGGMGVVFLAEQTEPVQRRVALKIIKPGMDTAEVIARFEAERQALALMDHPGIARVFDAGTTAEQRPYFVMELVEGEPITAHCDRRKLGTRARLELFTLVCRAVQHAHQKGVIHRDLKPGNILVAEVDGQAVPKVIDFGVAKATEQRLTQKTLATQVGQIVGTLEYMSPEQSSGDAGDVDTRSDIYSLGIVLYELLTGDTPFGRERLRSAGLAELLRILREEEPPRPSSKLSTSRTLAQVAAERDSEPRRLTSRVRGDLDWIVLKTLAKSPAGRYASASELAEDISRHLRLEPILAGPPRALTRLTKFAARNRRGLVTVAVLVASLASWVVWSAGQRADRAAGIASRSQRASEALEQASLSLGVAIATPLGRGAEWETARAGRARVDDFISGDELSPVVSARIASFHERFDLADLDRRLAEQIEEVVISGATYSDLASWQRMEASLRAVFADHGFDLDGGDPQQIALRIREHPRASRWTDALELWIATRSHMGQMGGPPTTQATMQPWAEAMYAADPDPVRTGVRRLIYAARPFTPAQVEQVIAGVDLTSLSPRTLAWIANVFLMSGDAQRFDEVSQLGIRTHPGDLMLTHDYAYGLVAMERWQEAIRMFTRCLALRDDVAGIWQGLGMAHVEVEEFASARDALERACELEPGYAPNWSRLGELLLTMELPADALAAGRRSVATDPDAAGGHGVVGRALLGLGRPAEALPELERCHALGAADPTWHQPSQEWLDSCHTALGGS